MEFKFIELETKGLTGEALEFANSYNENQKKNFENLASAMESKGMSLEAVQKMLSDNQEAVKAELAKEAASMTELKSLENDLLKRINDATKNVIEVKGTDTLVEKIVTALQSLEIKSAADMNKLKGTPKVMELKDALLTTAYTGDVTRSKVLGEPKFAPILANAFLGVPGVGGGTVEGGKSILVWVTGTYTSNVGYVGEGNAIGTDDAATGVEMSRQMAKVSAKLPMSTETFEDLPQFAQRLVDKLTKKAGYFLDTEIWSGDGNDVSAKQHIYGVKGQATEFDYTTYGATYTDATILDLLDACGVQAELQGFKVNTVRLNPKTASKMRRVKDKDGQPIVQQLVDGSPSIGGLRLITNAKIGADEMLVSDDSLIQIWTKRSMDLKVGQFGLDVEKDLYSAILFARYQCLIEDTDKQGVILVSSIADAVDGINVTPLV